MRPLRRSSRPAMPLSVVDLPAPLRPIRATTSPCPTLSDTPCRMWAAPYQACRSATSSKGVFAAKALLDKRKALSF